MTLRSFIRSSTVVALGGLVLLGAGCGTREEAPTGSASSSTVTVGTSSTRPTGTDSIAAAPSACDNPYYPLRQGYEIRYQSTFPAVAGVSSSGYTLRVTEALVNSVKLAATFDSSTPGQSPITSEQLIDCSNGGLTARSYLDFGSRLTGDAAANQFRAVTRNATGEMMPADVRIGSEWRNGFDVRLEAVDPASSVMARPIDMTVAITRRALAEEAVRVPAGEYQALKIAATTDLGMGSTISGTEWWVRGVGMVKSVYNVTAGSAGIVTEATRVTIPR